MKKRNKTDNNTAKYWKEKPELFNNSYLQKKSFAYFVHLFLNSRMRESIEVLESVPVKNKKILDIGCGGGQYLEYFLNKGGNVTGVDYSPKMILIANRYLKDRNFKNFSLRVADVRKLPFPNNNFDVVIGIGLLEYLVDPELAMTEITRILKPRGYCLLSFSKKNSPFFFLRFFPGILLRNYFLKLPKLITVFNVNHVNFLLRINKIKVLKKREIMLTEWLILGQKQ